jgi:nicotinamidase-related amidase
LLFVDPYDDFLDEGGKLWPSVAEVANAVGLHENLRAVTAAARKADLPIFIVPHHRVGPDDLKDWDHPTPRQLPGAELQIFAKGS